MPADAGPEKLLRDGYALGEVLLAYPSFLQERRVAEHLDCGGLGLGFGAHLSLEPNLSDFCLAPQLELELCARLIELLLQPPRRLEPGAQEDPNRHAEGCAGDGDQRCLRVHG